MLSRLNDVSQDDFSFGERIVNSIRWPLLALLLLFNNLGFAQEGSPVWPVNIALLAGLGLTGYIHYRLRQGHSLGRRPTLALAVAQDALITTAVCLTGFYDSQFFVFYYPSLLGFSLAFSLRTSLAYASVVGLAYTLLSGFLTPGLSGDPLLVKVLAMRWLILYIVVLIGCFVVREEWARRQEAVTAARRTAQENADLADSLNRQMDNWQLIGQANDRAAERLAALAQDLTGLAGEMGAGSEGISAATQEITGRAKTFVEQVAAIGQVASQVVSAADELAASASPTGIASEQAQHAVTEATEAVESLSQRAQAIGDLSTAVRRVADQTNLLAFNANVEAIQAGEKGQRFAVVANEVRLVADRAINLAREIGELSDEVQEGTRRVLNAMSQIATMVDQTVSLVQVTSQASTSQQSSAVKVAHSASTLEIVSQQNATDIQAVADTVHRQRTALQRIAVLGQELADSASNLRSLTKTVGG